MSSKVEVGVVAGRIFIFAVFKQYVAFTTKRKCIGLQSVIALPASYAEGVYETVQ